MGVTQGPVPTILGPPPHTEQQLGRPTEGPACLPRWGHTPAQSSLARSPPYNLATLWPLHTCADLDLRHQPLLFFTTAASLPLPLSPGSSHPAADHTRARHAPAAPPHPCVPQLSMSLLSCPHIPEILLRSCLHARAAHSSGVTVPTGLLQACGQATNDLRVAKPRSHGRVLSAHIQQQ